MDLALGQFNAVSDKAANLAVMASMAGRGRTLGAEMIVFPEAAMLHFDFDHDLDDEAEPLDGPFVHALETIARDQDIAIVAGLIESNPDEPKKVFNTVIALGRDGTRLGAYRKIHLFDAFGFAESDWFATGSGDLLTFSYEGLCFGVMTCYDLRFPELARELTNAGADVLLVPSAWVGGPLKEAQWETLLKARAIENTVYVAGADQVGGLLAGRSMVIDPAGYVLAAGGEVQTVVVGNLSRGRIDDVRARVPSLKHARPEVYAAWSHLAPAAS